MSFPRIPTHIRYKGRKDLIPLVEASPAHCVYKPVPLKMTYTLCLTNLTLTSGMLGDVVRYWDSSRRCFTGGKGSDVYPVWEDSQ